MYGISLTPAERKARRHSDHVPAFVPGYHVYRVVQSWQSKKWLLYSDNERLAEYDYRNDAEKARTALYDRQWDWKMAQFQQAENA